MRLQREYRECSLMHFTETWLNHLTPDSLVQLDGFHLVRADRNIRESGKKKGGGIALFVNDKWCNPGHIHVKKQRCTRDIELLAVSIRPYYLPREFSHVIAITTYIPPSANAEPAASPQCCALQTEHPQLFSSSPGILTISPKLCTDNKTGLYANTAGAYSSSPLPPLGRSDHNLVHLRPVYTPMVKRQPPNKRRVKQWSEEARDALRDCFDTTDWEVLCGPHEQDIDSLTDCITDYINFCVETTVPTKRARCFSNNKPWVTPDLGALLQEKRTAFQSGDRDELRRVQRDLKRKIKECKASYRRKMEDHLQQNNGEGGLERGLQAISGQGKNERRNPEPGDRDWANKLNLFFNRFDTGPTSTPLSLSTAQPTSSSLCLHAPHHHQHLHHLWGSHHPPAFTTISTVRTQLKKIKARKATGPDGISSRLLRDCADQLCQVVCYIFNLSLSLERVPFAYQPGIGVDDAVIYLLQRSLSHLEDAGNTVRITFFDFSSAFNTIHPSLLRVKLERAGASDQLAAWVTNYLTDRPQFVRLQDCVSDVVVCSTGAPQGTVLSPFLFTLYTSDFTYSTDSCHLQKFSDDTAIVGCVSEGNDCEYRKVIMDFVDWCELNHLQVNASKTKEMVIDFSRKPSDIAPVNIQGLDIERVRTYKYLGVHLNNKLDWTDNTDLLYKKGQSRLLHAEEAGIFWCVQATAEDLFMRLWWRLWSPMQWSAGEGGVLSGTRRGSTD
ncbi:hypothetical protein L3Q82_020850 [Scortum barcoo]|uniref:Uncharacterized protein n=1 Tax=Scortum barcoo TaxID=214431 RepID=A0ACB8V9K5_9TELE|nr:hypothetical protein L3Q82_020850 [Scortum barcoo]